MDGATFLQKKQQDINCWRLCRTGIAPQLTSESQMYKEGCTVCMFQESIEEIDILTFEANI